MSKTIGVAVTAIPDTDSAGQSGFDSAKDREPLIIMAKTCRLFYLFQFLLQKTFIPDESARLLRRGLIVGRHIGR